MEPEIAVPSNVGTTDWSPAPAQACLQEKEHHRRCFRAVAELTFPDYSRSQHMLHVLKLIEGLRRIADTPEQHSDSELAGFCLELEYHLGNTTDKRFFDPGSDAEKELASVLLKLLLSPSVGPVALSSVCSLIRSDQVVIKNCGIQLDWRKIFYRFSIICGQILKAGKTALSQLKAPTVQDSEFVRVIGKISQLFPPQAYGELVQVLVDRHASRYHQWILYYALQKCPLGCFDWRPFVKFLAETPPYNPNGTFIIARILRRNFLSATPIVPSSSLVVTLFNFVFFSLDCIGPSGFQASGVVTISSSELWTELEIIVHLCSLCPDTAIPLTLQLLHRLELFVHPNGGTRDSNVDHFLLKLVDHILLNTMRSVRKARNPASLFLSPLHYHTLVTPLLRIVSNALMHENASVRSLAISSIGSILQMGSPLSALDMIDDKVRAVFSDLGLTASHHTPMVIQLAISLLPSILSAVHPSYPFQISPQYINSSINAALLRFSSIHGYDTSASALDSKWRAIYVASDPEPSLIAHRRSKALLLLPFILTQLLEHLCASDLSIANSVLEFYESFCLMVPLFPLPTDAICCSDIPAEVWSAAVALSHTLQDWACDAFDKLLYMADHMLDSEEYASSATANGKKVGATLIALVNALPETAWPNSGNYHITRQSAHSKIIHILKVSMNWKHARSRMMLIRVFFNTNPEISAASSLVHALADRIIVRNGTGTPTADSEDFSSIVGLPEGVKFVSLSPEELAYNVWLLWQCLASCRCTVIFGEKLKGERLMDKIVLVVHCMLLLHNEALASLPNFRDFALHRDLFTHTLHLMKATMEAQCGLFHSATSREYFMVPPVMWNDPIWHSFSYISWGRGVSTAHVAMQPSTTLDMPHDLHSSILMNFTVPLESLASNSSDFSDKILEKYMMMARQTLCVLMPQWHALVHHQRAEYASKPEFQVVVPPDWQVHVRLLRHEYCHFHLKAPTPDPFPEIGATAALFTDVLEKVSQRALKDNSVTIAASVLSLAQYWCNDITIYSEAANLLHFTTYDNQLWIRKRMLSNMEAVSSFLLKAANHVRCTVFEYFVAKAVLPLLFHSIESVRVAAIAALGKIMIAHPRLVSQYLYDLVMPIAMDLSCSEHTFAGCILFFENASIQKLYSDDAIKRMETVKMIVWNQERVIEDPKILDQYLYFAGFSFVDAITPCYPQALRACAADAGAAAAAFLNSSIDSTSVLQQIIDAYVNKEVHWKIKECGFRLFEVMRLAGHHVNFRVFDTLLKEACCEQLGAKMYITDVDSNSLGVHSLVTQSINGVVQSIRESIQIVRNGGIENHMMAKRIGHHDRDFVAVSTADAADVERRRQQRSSSRRAFIGEVTPEFLTVDERSIIDAVRGFLVDERQFKAFAATRCLNCSSNADQVTADLHQFQNSQELQAHIAEEYITFFSLLTSMFGRLVLCSARHHIEKAFQLFSDADSSDRLQSVTQRHVLPDCLPQFVFAIEAFVGIISGSKHLLNDEILFIRQEFEPLLQIYLDGVSGIEQIDFEFTDALEFLTAHMHPGSLDWLLSALLKPVLTYGSDTVSLPCSTHGLVRRLKCAYSLAANHSTCLSAPLEQFVSVAHLFSVHPSSLVRERVSKLVGTCISYRLSLARSFHDIVDGYDGPVVCSSTWQCFVDYFERVSNRLKVVEDGITAHRHSANATGSSQPSSAADPIEHTVVVIVQELGAAALGQVVGFVAPAVLNLLFRLSALRDQDYAEELELSPVTQVPWVCDMPLLSSDMATNALHCCIDFCSSPKLWTRIMATGAIAILCFRHQMVLTPDTIGSAVRVVNSMLKDTVFEVREKALVALRTILRCCSSSQKLDFQASCLSQLQASSRTAVKLVEAAIFGLVALIECDPYDLSPSQVPILKALVQHAHTPPPISKIVGDALTSFWRNHRDHWHLERHLISDADFESELLEECRGKRSYYI